MIPELGRSPGGGHGNPLQYSCLKNPHGQRSLAGYSPWGHKDSDMTEGLSTAYKMLIIGIWLLYDVSTCLGCITQLLSQILIWVLL